MSMTSIPRNGAQETSTPTNTWIGSAGLDRSLMQCPSTLRPRRRPSPLRPARARERDGRASMRTEFAVGTRGWWALRIGAAGVVYGDIGTSPLYTWNEARHTGTLTSAADVLGAASLVFWTVTLGITVKYLRL